MSQPTNFRVLALKYRPGKFSELVGQDSLVKTLTNAFLSSRVAHAFLLHGVRGVGKTSTARIIAKALNCLKKEDGNVEPCNACENCTSIQMGRNVDVIEMDGASKTGVNDIREIIETVYYRAASSKFKIYIIDEVHMLSNAAFNALLKTLEEPPEHVKFILATTEIQKIPATVLSRVQRYDLKRVNSSAIVGHLEKILQKENIVSEGGALKLVSREAEGSLRDALSLLDQVIVNSTGAVKIQTVNELLGKISKIKIFDLLSLILSGKTADTIIKAREYFQGSISPESLLRELMNIVHFVSLVVISNDFLSDESYTVEEQNRAKEIAKSTNTIRISSLWQILFKESVSIKVALDAIISFEMLIIKATHMSLLPEPESLIKSILENKEEHLKVIHSGKSIANLVREDKKEEKFLENKFYDVIETEHQKGEEQAIKEILEIFPGAKIDN